MCFFFPRLSCRLVLNEYIIYYITSTKALRCESKKFNYIKYLKLNFIIGHGNGKVNKNI